MTSPLDKLTPGAAQDARKTEAPARAHVQALGKNLVSQLFMVLRTVRLHDKRNKSVLVATEHLKDTLNTIIGAVGEVRLEFVEDQVYLSDQRIRVEYTGQENVKELASEFNRRGLGGFTFKRSVTTPSLTELLVAFNDAADQADSAKFMRDRLADLHDLAVELLGRRKFADNKQVVPELKVDPRLLALQTYAKAVIAVKRFVAELVTPPEAGKGGMRLKLVRIVQDLVDLSDERANLLLKLVAIKDSNDYPFNHAVNVCVLSIAIGRAIGLGREDLVDLGMSGMMADLGFAVADSELAEKASALDDQELEKLHESTIAAVRVLLGKGALTRGAMRRLIVAFQHHIHCDLKGGYPQLERPRPLHLFSRIVAICDNYDALTTNRPWREAFSPDEALKILAHGAGSKFDPTLVRIFVNLLGLYPIGTAVILSNGEVGMVYHTTDDPKRFDRPFVRVLRNPDGRPVERTVIRDLAEQSGGQFKYSIVKVIDQSAIDNTARASLFNG
ncbi:MAG: hypothetical protein JXR83_19510 [Deltaproteobacteria bacterium]|nr:hypothetical protein [Deltaproteobacteria bacterium]